MWMTTPDDVSTDPVELKLLKQKLGKLSNSICKCIRKRPKYTYATSTSVCVNYGNSDDKEVQVKEVKTDSFDQFTQATQDTITIESKAMMQSLTKDILCPTCFVTMNLLRGGSLKILKDEEVETKVNMFSQDKSTEKCIESVEKTTSFTKQNLKGIHVVNSDYNNSSDPLSSQGSKCRHHQVKFLDDSLNLEQAIPKGRVCSCLENFMNAIRPPVNAY